MARSNPSKSAGDGKTRGRSIDSGLALFSLNGPFAQYSGPALVAGPAASVLASNDAAEELVELIKGKCPAELRTALNTAMEGRSAQISPLLLNTGPEASGAGDEGVRALELTILPWSEGSAVLVLGRDATLDRRLRQALIESQHRYKDIVGLLTHDFAWETDAEGRFVYVSADGALGYAADELLGASASDHAAEAAAETARAIFSTQSKRADQPLNLTKRGGGEVPVVASAVPLFSSEGRWTGARGLCRDMSTRTAATRTAEQGHKREKLLSAILRMSRGSASPQAMLDTIAAGLPTALGSDGAAIYRLVDGAFKLAARAGGPAPGAVMHDLLARIEAGERDVEGADEEVAVVARATTRHEEVNGLLYLWQGLGGPCWSDYDHALLGDMTEQVGEALRRLARQEELSRLSASDSLTGLANRRSFVDSLAKRISGEGASSLQPGNLLYIEATNFKLVNARRGHHAGDQVLAAMARLIHNQVGPDDLIGRLDGDAFAIFLEEASSDAAVQRARNLVKTVREGFGGETGDPVQPLGIAIGVAGYDPSRLESVSDLLERGHRAMSRKKRSGGDAVGLCDLRRT